MTRLPNPNRRHGAFFYLATPYSKYAGGIDAAFAMACRTAAALLKAGLPVFSPIAHSHPIAVHGEIDPYNHSIWLPADRSMMESALALIVYCESGWLDSFGMWEEIKEFKKAGKPVLYLSPRRISDAIRFLIFVSRALELADEVRG